QVGSWRQWGWRYKPIILLSWYFIGPVITRLLGYLPASLMGGGESLPGGVARQWARWGRHPDYLLGEHPHLREAFASLLVPVVLVSIDDDELYAPRQAVDKLARWYSGAQVERWHWQPGELGLERLG